MGGGGGGMEVKEVPLSTGALEAMWREDGLRPVLQLADEPRMVAGRYRVALSDGGARLQPGMLAASLNHLVARGALRRGTVIRVLDYFAGFIRNQRVIIVIQIEILHSECTLVRSPTIFQANATSNTSCSPDKRVLDSSVTPRAEPTVINLPFSECFCSMPAQTTVDAKMKQLSLNDHQNQRFMVTTTGDAFGPPVNSYASPMLASYLQDSPGLSGAMAPQLTHGAVVALSEHTDGNGTLQPLLQVVDVKVVNDMKNPFAERFRMVLSDGIYTMQSMLATIMNTRVLDGSIQKGSIIHLQEFTCSTIEFRRIIIVLKLDVLQSEGNIMGNPKPYEMRNQPNERVTNLPANAARASTVTYSSGPGITPVSALNPYQTRWTIKVRVTSKTDLRHYDNARGAQKVFYFDLLDGHGGEIRARCFNAQADQFFDLIEVDKLYLISGGSVKPAQKKFNSLNHEYEITLNSKTSIEVCLDDDNNNIPRQQYNFRQISKVENIEEGALGEMVGTVTSASDESTHGAERSNTGAVRGKPPLHALFSDRITNMGTYLSGGGIGLSTPPHVMMQRDHSGLSSSHPGSKRDFGDEVVDSPRKKQSLDLEDYMARILESIAARSTSRDRKRTREQKEVVEAMQILRDDGVPIPSVMYFTALELFKNPVSRREFLNMDGPEVRIPWLTWHMERDQK